MSVTMLIRYTIVCWTLSHVLGTGMFAIHGVTEVGSASLLFRDCRRLLDRRQDRLNNSLIH
jgi:hypothetical protein